MEIRDRIKELRRVPAHQLKANDKNWNTHPPAQREALRVVLAGVGFADACLAREDEAGELILIDGHMRVEENPTMNIPVLVLDVNEEEADVLLATLDPVAAMAKADHAKLNSLIEDIDANGDDLNDFLETLTVEVPDESKVELKQLPTQPPPKMTWALIGIPTVRYGEIAETIELLAAIPDTVVHTASNDQSGKD